MRVAYGPVTFICELFSSNPFRPIPKAVLIILHLCIVIFSTFDKVSVPYSSIRVDEPDEVQIEKIK